MQSKSSRAFRTISEASEELDLKPHVLRFWEAKFPDLKPITRGGGRRFYRPEDIDFLRGLRILLHDEKHKIKDVQKLIKVKGAQSVVELGFSAGGARPSRPIEQRDLVPERIKAAAPEAPKPVKAAGSQPAPQPKPIAASAPMPAATPAPSEPSGIEPVVVPFTPPPSETHLTPRQRADLQASLDRLTKLRGRWSDFLSA